MKPFHTIAVPHRDILDGKLTMDVFAADLWETYLGRAPSEYRDSTTFFKKTYLTQGLKNLLNIVGTRLRGEGGDPVIQIQTPFGGGKTHALIAMFHRANEWKAKTVVFVGTALGPQETIWGTIEKQLTGTIKRLAGNVSPGREGLREVLQVNQPLLILMDEVYEYATKVAGVAVEDSTLAAQTIAFMQELTEVAATLDKVCVVVTLPSSILEHYDEKLFHQLQKVTGRVERIYTPVQENEINKVIRRRLFSSVDDTRAKVTISEVVDYLERESILPAGKEPSEYRESFLESFPFTPEVVEILYHRWGSFPTFQRTRGVLRLLSLVIYSLKQSGRPYLSLADFDLGNEEVKRELIKHIGPEFDSVVAADITNKDSGTKRIDKSLGRSFEGLTLGTRSSTSTFLYSFSGGQEKGAHIGEVKRSATTTENPSSVIAEALEQLKGKLFFLQSQNDKYFFSNQPNLNRILLTKIENIKAVEAIDSERQLIGQQIRGGKLKVFLWPDKPKDIPDTEELKLVIVPDKNQSFMEKILETKGDTPRVHKNTIFFLSPSETEKASFQEVVKRRIAYEQIETDKTVNLSEEQKKEIRNNLKRIEASLQDSIRGAYRLVYAPSRSGVREVDIGIPTFGENKGIDQEVYEKLRAEGEILERVAPVVIREKYLKERDEVNLRQLRESMLNTPGERRTISAEVLVDSVKDGVKQGLFGLGESRAEGRPKCRFYKEDPVVSFAENEVLVRDEVCLAQRQVLAGTPGTQEHEAGPIAETAGGTAWTTGPGSGTASGRVMKELELRFRIPRGKVSQIMGLMNYLQSKFQQLELQIRAKEGSMSEEEYAAKIREALQMAGIDLEHNE
jgi:hypothetical protein